MAKKSNKKTSTKKQSTAKSNDKTNQKIIDDLKKQLNDQKENVDKQFDKYKRLLAEFDNYKRRTDKEKNDLSSMAIINFSKDIITIIDDFERTLDSIPELNKKESYINGIQLIFDKLTKILLDKGIESFESQNENFDPEIHEAISIVNDKKIEDGVIINEYLKGYKYKQKIIRHAQVVVAKNKK